MFEAVTVSPFRQQAYSETATAGNEFVTRTANGFLSLEPRLPVRRDRLCLKCLLRSGALFCAVSLSSPLEI